MGIRRCDQMGSNGRETGKGKLKVFKPGEKSSNISFIEYDSRKG